MLVPSLLWKLLALIVPVFTLACQQTAQFVHPPTPAAAPSGLPPRSPPRSMSVFFIPTPGIFNPGLEQTEVASGLSHVNDPALAVCF